MKRHITKRVLWLGVIILVAPLLLLLSCQGIITLATAEISKSKNPPTTLQESDLVGTWKADYGSYGGVDELILSADRTFKQIYKNSREGYVFETPWDKWWLERFPDGRVRVHLKGARYFPDDMFLAEVHESKPWIYCDPFVKEEQDWKKWSVNMEGKLVLNIRLLPSGELVLYHMWAACGDGAFTDSDVFHRPNTPPQAATRAP